MNSDLPKVCHPVGGRPMVCAVVDACFEVGCEKVVLVVGYRQDLVREAVAGYGDRVSFAVQDEQHGTGHAVQCAADHFQDEQSSAERHEVFVLCGDGPLIRAQTLQSVLDTHRSARAAATLATSVIPDPDGYGRIVRDDSGRFSSIVEQKNASAEQLAVREVNPSYYCFDCKSMFDTLNQVERDAASGEYYLTPVPSLLQAAGAVVEVIEAVPPQDVLSINTPENLAEVDRVFRNRQSVIGGDA